MVKVRLIAYNKPLVGPGDPRRLPLLGFKISVGKLHDNPIEYYLSEDYSEDKTRRILLSAVEFPSILEHITFTFLIEDVSRICSHQLVRHRLVSFTQESQRYSESYMRRIIRKIVDSLGDELFYKMYDKGEYSDIIGIFLEKTVGDKKEGGYESTECVCLNENYCKVLLEAVEEAFVIPKSIDKIDNICLARDLLFLVKKYYELIENGARYEDARFILPQAIKTRLLATLNLRELLHIACLRLSPKAQWEIREVVSRMIDEVGRIIPEVYELIKGYCGEHGVK